MAGYEQGGGPAGWPRDQDDQEGNDLSEARTLVGVDQAVLDQRGEVSSRPAPSVLPQPPQGSHAVAEQQARPPAAANALSVPRGVKVKRRDAADAAPQQSLLAISWLGEQHSWTARAIIDSRYRLLEALGRGGMGDVILAEDLFLRRKVALKTLRRNLADDPEALDSFRQEVAMAHAVSHPGLARTFDLGEASGVTYLTMEYLEGETLSNRIKRLGPLPLPEVQRIAMEVAAAVDAAHTAGVIHRDLKPSNIQLTSDRGAVVMDFGLAAAIRDESAARPAAARSELIRPTTSSAGTPYYMAPEQWRGEPQGVATDIYAFGAILFEALTGRTPFLADNRVTMMNAHLQQKAPSVRSIRPQVPAALDRLVAACLEKDPRLRPPSMEAVARKLVGRSVLPTLVTLGIAVAVLLLIMAGGWTIWWTTSALLLREIRPAVQRLAEIAALRIDGRDLVQVRQEADIETDAFRNVWNVFDQLRKENPEVKYVYTLRKLEKENDWEYVVDVDPKEKDENGDGTIEDDEKGCPPGEEFDSSPYPQLARTFREKKPQADRQFIADAWGILLSGYAPVKAPGDEFHLVGIDVGNDPLVRLRNTLLGVFFLLGLATAGLVLALRLRRAEALPGFNRKKS